MKFAVTLGAYSLANFVELNLKWVARVFGSDVPILISDDLSPESAGIKALAEKYGCHYVVTSQRAFHFQGDWQHIINSIAFAKSIGADFSVKISQRLIILHGDILKVVDQHFDDPTVAISLPGRPAKHSITGSQGFNVYPFLTDVMFMRTSEFDPGELKRRYESKLINSKNYWDSLVEFMVNDLVMTDYRDRHRVHNELTEHIGGPPHKFLRRYQNQPQDYVNAALSVGLDYRFFQTGEWRQLDHKYDPRPRM